METNKEKEGQPRNINPDEINKEHPAKAIKAQQKIEINQSGFGREQGQTLADEHIESFSQIDGDTKNSIDKKNHPGETNQTSGYMNDATSADRDTGNGIDDNWNQNESRSARHK